MCCTEPRREAVLFLRFHEERYLRGADDLLEYSDERVHLLNVVIDRL